MASVSKRQWTYKGTTKEAWTVRYVDKGGAHRSKQFERKKEAEAYKRRVEGEIDAGTHIPHATAKTLGDLIDEWSDHYWRKQREGQVSYSHVRSRTYMLVRVKKYLGNVKLPDLTWQQIEQYFLDMRINGKVPKTGKPYSSRYHNSVMYLVGQVIAFGQRRGYVVTNQASMAIQEVGPMATARIEPFTTLEIKALLAALESPPPVWRFDRTAQMTKAYVYLGAMCGLRYGEIQGLRLDAIDWDRNTITIEHSVDLQDTLKGPKTAAGNRTVPMPGPVKQALEEWLPHYVANDRRLMFRTATGGWLPPGNFIQRMWRPLLDHAGIKATSKGHRKFHALRHFAGSVWLDGGVPLADVAKLMGHAHSGVTASVYAHALSDQSHRFSAVEALAQSLLPAPVAQELRKAA